jgi:N-acetylmuramoyl-L-alanine amidase
MRQLLGLLILGSALIPTIAVAQEQSQSLKIAYPPPNHQTVYDKIFFIGTAPAAGQVLVNGNAVKRSPSGHFAPSFPLQLGENVFSVRYQNQEVQIKVVRTANQPVVPTGLAFAKDSLTPAVDVAKLAGEPICFSAVAKPNSTVSVKLGNLNIPLVAQPPQSQLPASNAVLTGKNQPIAPTGISKYEGCTLIGAAEKNLDLGKPEFQLTQNGQTTTQPGTGQITILSPTQLQIAEVTTDAGVARTGASTDYSRLTPLPKSTRAAIIGREGDWLQLDYGGWINSKETKILPAGTVPPRAIIRSVGYRKLADRTEMVFPLSAAVPVTVQQGSNTFSLTLHNTTAQTDVIRLDDNPLISRLDWQQVAPGKAQYTFNLKKAQQWGYKLRYEGTSLVLSLRHPPTLVGKGRKPLMGIKVLVDAGHGGKESGAPGPGGIFEKEINLQVSKLVQAELIKLGATVVMTREDDRDVSLVDRMAKIDREEPVLSVSVHYNSLPDNGDLEKTKGVGVFWYNAQAHSLAVFMQKHLVQKLQRPSYGVFWNNLALTRPTAAPSVLLELGFVTNPAEYEWVTNAAEQKKLARSIAQGIYEWLQSVQ